MPESDQKLGKLVAVHGIAPAYLQRAVFIVILSFLFFLAMMLVYYIRQNGLYFLLASAFLVLYLVTLFSFVLQRRSVVEVYEEGLKFKKRSASWSEITGIANDGSISLTDGKQIILPKTLNDRDSLITCIRRRVA